MRVLVTGGTGFLGRAFAGRARAAGHQVITLDSGEGADLRCDVADPVAVADAVAGASPGAVVHLAALLTDAAGADAVQATRVNALGTAAVFQAAARARAARVVYASSIAAVGPCPENSGDGVALGPGSVYGATKAFGEHLARAMAAAPGAPAFVALRFGWIYGPGRERGWRVLQDVIDGFVRGQRPVVFPDFAAPVDWTFIEDAAEVLRRAVERPLDGFRAFNAVGDRRTVREAVAHLQRRFPAVEAQAAPAAAPPSGWGVRNDGLEAALGYAPATRLEDGIDAMLGFGRGPGPLR